jgi:peroxiredoxin family protein
VLGDDPPWAVAPPTHSPQERSSSIIICGVCASGRDEVRTFGAWWGLEMFKMSQIADKHVNLTPQNLG